MIRDDYDVIVIGAGAAGLSAASTAAAEGRKVLLLEHTDRVGGTTAVSGGMVWIPANHKMTGCGLSDSKEAAREYLSKTVPGGLDDARMQAYLERGDAAIRYLESHTSVRLRPVVRYPDYYPRVEGATPGGRVLEPVPYDGRELGSCFKFLRDPLPEFLLWGGMMIGREDIPKLRKIGKSLSATWHCTKLLARHALQRTKAHRGTSLVLGNALAARLYKSAIDLGVTFSLNTRVQSLQVEDGRIKGVTGVFEGVERCIRAKNAVILSTGGISHDTQLRGQYVPDNARQASATVNAGAKLNGARLASAAGAQLSQPTSQIDESLAFWVPVSTWTRADGSSAVFPHTVTDRSKPGLIAVNLAGQRFTNEALSYHEFGKAQLRDNTEGSPAWLICDRQFLWKYGLGKVRPFALSLKNDLASGYLRTGESITDLAVSISIPPAELLKTISAFNSHARMGQDPAFQRGSDIYQRHLGDAEHAPNPCVAPIEKGPFYAVAVRPSDLGMAAGIRTNAETQVLNANGTPIEGLYACGNDMESIMRGAYPGPGITLGPALVFGVIAGLNASGRSLQ